MLKETYARVGRIAYTIASPLLRAYPKNNKRVRVLVINHRDEVLLARSWFGYQRWSLPGGGIKRKEDPKAAAVREVYEEAGVRLHPEQLRQLGQFENKDSGAPFVVDCYMAEIDEQPSHTTSLRQLEILDVGWFPLRDIPENHGTTVDKAVRLYRA